MNLMEIRHNEDANGMSPGKVPGAMIALLDDQDLGYPNAAIREGKGE